MKENRRLASFWLLAAAGVMISVWAASGIYSGLENPTSMEYIIRLISAIAFSVALYRLYARTRYPQALTITTEKGIATIYTDEPGRIARALGVAE